MAASLNIANRHQINNYVTEQDDESESQATQNEEELLS